MRFGVAAELLDGVAHGGQVDDGGHAREVLHHDARGHEEHLALGGLGADGAGHGLDVGLLDDDAVLVRRRFSRKTFIERGILERSKPFWASAARLRYSYFFVRPSGSGGWKSCRGGGSSWDCLLGEISGGCSLSLS